MILESGSKLLVVHRRLYREDEARFFVGTVEKHEDGLASVRGYTWIKDSLAGDYYRKEDVRTKIISLVSGTYFLYLLPGEADLSRIRIEAVDHKVLITDGQALFMDLTEYEFHRSKRAEK